MDIYQEAYEYLLEHLVEVSEYVGGTQRTLMGELVENFVDFIWEKIQDKYNDSSSKITVGSTKPIKVVSPSGYSIAESVDRHIYINRKIVAAIECKTYLDKCYLQRADSDFALLKTNENFASIILSLQNACSENSFNFFLDRGNIDKIFILSNVKKKQ